MRPGHVFTRISPWSRKPSSEDRADSFELALSARRFSRRTQAVVEDKLSFSAALMRAGEVEAANRLLAEVGEEVLEEEVALLERVNEVKCARINRPPVTRGRLVRTLAVAMLGTSLFAFSAAGAAVAGWFRDDQAVHGADPGSLGAAAVGSESVDRVKGTRQVKILDNVSLPMTAQQFRRYTQLTTGEIDPQELETFLMKLLPAVLAEKVHFALVSGLEVLPDPVAEEVDIAMQKIASVGQASAERDSSQQPAPDKSADSEEKPEPTPDPSPSESEPTPDPEETPEDQEGIPLFGGDGEG